MKCAIAPRVTLAAFAASWLAAGAHRLKPLTIRNYRTALQNYLLPALGDVEMEAIQRRDVRLLLLALRDRGLAAGTVRQALATLRACYTVAVDEEVVAINPCVRLGRAVASRKDVRWHVVPSLPQVRTMLEHCRLRCAWWFPAVLTLARAGLRISELTGLQPGDLDFDVQTIQVCRQERDGRVWSTKSSETRNVDMADDLGIVLLDQPRDGVWLFPRRANPGRSIDQRELCRIVARCGEAAGVAGAVSPHSLRHAWASALAAKGVSIDYLAKQLGHADPAITLRLYARHYRHRNLSAVNSLAEPDD